ncbi:hypothetical protein SAMN05444266_101466 [Chitinophaga jiangningensis]|uniref:Uncharacterized protein n=1 Tax=Chitinophaga jiangningensis TaxID=1419482 RepID=A0A1M6W3J4_9BACT|nr:hypothetical protein [Chitinophaga jiangningensis]SHK88176.1 hypothetical protein SAMN05444266_101466 [Chitinophaga jiangningensis]
MKYLVIILVFAGLLLENASKGLIVLQYWANQQYIAQNLCENRDKPQMHCNGRCHLKKELEKDAQPEKSSNTNKESYEVMFVNELQSFLQAPPANEIIHSGYYKDPVLPTPVFAIFHPPQWYNC